jgi:hypothetical protein
LKRKELTGLKGFRDNDQFWGQSRLLMEKLFLSGLTKKSPKKIH